MLSNECSLERATLPTTAATAPTTRAGQRQRHGGSQHTTAAATTTTTAAAGTRDGRGRAPLPVPEGPDVTDDAPGSVRTHH